MYVFLILFFNRYMPYRCIISSCMWLNSPALCDPDLIWYSSVLVTAHQVMFYNGALDVICSLSAEEAVLDNMDWDLRDLYEKAPKKIWRVQSADKEVAGYVHHVRNLYQVCCTHYAGMTQIRNSTKWIASRLWFCIRICILVRICTVSLCPLCFQVAVRGAGHMVPTDQPRAAFDMITRFVFHKGFDK